MELFSQVATGFRGELRILSNSYDKVFCKNSEKRKAVHYFYKKLHLGMLGKVLIMLLNWLSKLTMFHFQINLNIKGNRKPSTRKKQRERANQTSKQYNENDFKQS